jgi:hypothetical protein
VPLIARAVAVLLFFSLAACAGGRGTHIEPQVAPGSGKAIAHSPVDPRVVLITEYAGALSVWRFADLSAPERLATVFTDAHRAAFSADGKTLVVAGKDGRLRILDFDGASIAESRDTIEAANLPSGLAVDPDGQRIVTTGRDGIWQWSLPDLDRSPIEEKVHASAVSSLPAVRWRSATRPVPSRSGRTRRAPFPSADTERRFFRSRFCRRATGSSPPAVRRCACGIRGRRRTVSSSPGPRATSRR